MMQVGQNLSLARAELQSKDGPFQGPHAGQKWLSLYTTFLLSHWLGTARADTSQLPKQRQTLKARTAGDDQITTFLEAGLISPSLEGELSAITLCLPQIPLKIPSRGWPTLGQES